MGRIKDIYIAREELREELAKTLGEHVEIEETEWIEWWKFVLADGVVLAKIDDLLYVEPAPIECDAKNLDEIREAIYAARSTRN